MKRKSMQMLRRASWAKQGPDALLRWREADDILAELARLRREVKDLRSTCRLASDELDDVNGYLPASLMSGGHVYEALKKGGRK